MFLAISTAQFFLKEVHYVIDNTWDGKARLTAHL
jgi:hypothetical protein